MVREETAIAQKIIKIFPHEDIMLNTIFSNRKPDISFKNHNLLLKLMKETTKSMTQMMKKKQKTRLKRIILKFFDVNPMILILIFINF